MDNIAVAKKFILDGLLAAKKIKNDGWNEVVGWEEHFNVDRKNPRIEVEIEDVLAEVRKKVEETKEQAYWCYIEATNQKEHERKVFEFCEKVIPLPVEIARPKDEGKVCVWIHDTQRNSALINCISEVEFTVCSKMIAWVDNQLIDIIPVITKIEKIFGEDDREWIKVEV
jgi:hypothetical protein